MRADRPVFLSIGGGDASELEYLLKNSTATHGILLEGARPLAEAARRKIAPLKVLGKTLEIYEGDAKDKIGEACMNAQKQIRDGNADYIAVTCHAVIHELFDRGNQAFDPLAFFATIFEAPEISTWFTYREPGMPEKWPETVVLKADCTPQTLLRLTQAICNKHPALANLNPRPVVVGDAVRLNSAVAFEVISKLFYLDDLSHEISERSTAVNHSKLMTSLSLAIGDAARTERRASIESMSAPTQSFRTLWPRYQIDVKGLNSDDYSTTLLSIPESHTRVIAYRISPPSHTPATVYPENTSPATTKSEITRILAQFRQNDP